MPYMVYKGSGPRPWRIYNLETDKVVGTSETKEKAEASIRHRLSSDKDTKK